MHERRVGSLLRTHRIIFAYETRLGAADRRPLEQEAQVRGEAKPAGVSDALAVAQYHIGRRADLL
jgi:hypothetical protein